MTGPSQDVLSSLQQLLAIAQAQATSVFDLLDPKLKPTIAVAATCSSHPMEAPHLVVFTDNVPLRSSLAQAFESSFPQSDVRALLSQAATNDGSRADSVTFCSYPISIAGCPTCVLLELSKATYQSYYALPKGPEFYHYEIASSLLEATVLEFLHLCEELMSRPALKYVESRREPEEMIRAAGRFLMYTPGILCGQLDGVYGLFDSCNTISSLKYEGIEGIGSLLLSQQNHPGIEVSLQLVSPVPITDFRVARKLLEISSLELSLLADSAFVYGLGKKRNGKTTSSGEIFRIEFNSHFSWQLLHAGRTLMQVTYGQPSLPRPRIDKARFKREAKRILKEVTDAKAEYLWRLINRAASENHGSILVIAAGAAEEAMRLENQCIRTEPTLLDEELVSLLTAIDGAVLLDENAYCYAFGTILDGLATNKGTPARGARYNSAVHYVEGKVHCLAVVISDDGLLDLIPVSRSALAHNKTAPPTEPSRPVAKGRDREYRIPG